MECESWPWVFHCADPKMNFMHEVRAARTGAWTTLTLEFDRFVARDKSRSEKLPPGAAITEIYVMYGEPGDKGSTWVDSIAVAELRP